MRLWTKKLPWIKQGDNFRNDTRWRYGAKRTTTPVRDPQGEGLKKWGPRERLGKHSSPSDAVRHDQRTQNPTKICIVIAFWGQDLLGSLIWQGNKRQIRTEPIVEPKPAFSGRVRETVAQGVLAGKYSYITRELMKAVLWFSLQHGTT